MPEQVIIEHCSPTLAGIKTGSLFSVRFDSKENILKDIRELNRVFREKGLRAIPVNVTEKFALIYIYRPKDLERDIQNPKVWDILSENGYKTQNADRCVIDLIRHFKENKSFPHEVGLFLGYPPSDVKSFMASPTEGVKCTGYWKVYSNEYKAKKIFDKYKNCIEVYKKQIAMGKSLKQLIV